MRSAVPSARFTSFPLFDKDLNTDLGIAMSYPNRICVIKLSSVWYKFQELPDNYTLWGTYPNTFHQSISTKNLFMSHR